MNYQIVYKDELNIIDITELTKEKVGIHFSERGYEFLYVYKNGNFYDSLSFDEFRNDKWLEQETKEYHKDISDFNTNNDIESFFISHPGTVRIVLLDGNQLVGEVNLLDEQPLQNGVIKNLMALRYVDFFKDKIIETLLCYKEIYILASDETYAFVKDMFKQLQLKQIKSLSQISFIQQDENRIILDFLYGKKILKVFKCADKFYDFTKLLERFALESIIEYCEDYGLILRFYKLQVFEKLTCLHPWEINNFEHRTSKEKLAENDEYVKAFSVNQHDYQYLKERKYQMTLRLDDGFAFVQEDCNDKDLHVKDGVRFSSHNVIDTVHTAHFFGPCTTFGIMTPDNETVTSYFQENATEERLNINAINHAGLHGNNFLNSMMLAMKTRVKKGDALVFLDVLDSFPDESYPGLEDVNDWFNENKSTNEIYFFDFPGHCNALANKLMADKIYNDLKSIYTNMNMIDYLEDHTTFFDSQNLDYNPFRFFLHTNGSAIKMLHKMRKFCIEDDTGFLVYYGDDNTTIDLKFILEAASMCKRLFIFVSGEHLPYFEQIKTARDLFSEFQNNSTINVIQIEHYFNAARYLASETKTSDRGIRFLEKAFLLVVYNGLRVKKRFVKKHPTSLTSKMEKVILLDIYRDSEIEIIEIE